MQNKIHNGHDEGRELMSGDRSSGTDSGARKSITVETKSTPLFQVVHPVPKFAPSV